MFLRDTLLEVLGDPRLPARPEPEVARELMDELPRRSGQAVVLTGVRRSGKSVLQAQLMRRHEAAFYCNLEDTRLYGLGPADFVTFLSVLDELAPESAVFLDEVQEVPEWQRLVRSLLDRGRTVCITGSNASLLGRELGAKLTGRHLSYEVLPFGYREYLAYTRQRLGTASLASYLQDGGFPAYLRERSPQVLQELLRDIVQRDIAVRHRLRGTRHVMNLALFLLASTGRPYSLQSLTKGLAIPTVGQTSRYVEYLQDAYLLLALPKFSPSLKKRVVAPNKYYVVDNGLRRAGAPPSRDLGHRLENAVFLALRGRHVAAAYAAEKDSWECDFVTDDELIQVCAELTEQNRGRELKGLVRASRLPGKRRRSLILTMSQRDRLVTEGTTIDVRPAWEWMLE
ncbi:MAG: ATP-binding protein [Deltaproteobacteria bacterium]|nr:ATP-binding protein [Deltaproteobacteria bacterium]